MDEIKISGKWSIPGTDFIDFNGDLILNPSKNIIQVTAYTREPIGMFKEFDTVTGEMTNGSKVTLYKCYIPTEGITVGKNREYNAIIQAEYCFEGVHFQSGEEVLFHEITARFSYLDEWAFFKVFNFKPVKNFDYSFRYKRPKKIKYKISKETTLTIFSDLDFPFFSVVDKEVNITQKVFVSVKHKKPQTLKKSLDIIQTLMDFVSFCTFKKISYIEITGYNPDHFEKFKKIRDKMYHPIPIYLTGQIGEDYPIADPRDFLLNLHKLSDNFNFYINNWFSKMELLKPVIDQYLNTLGHYHLSAELYFLNLIQALESYHRRTRKNYVLDEAEHKMRLKSIIDLSPEHKVWLNEKLYKANEPNLKDRIDDLTREGDDFLIFFRGKKEREKFLEDVKNTRNYFTHYDNSLKDRALSGEELSLACEILKNIIEYHLLREIGFSYEIARPKIVKKLGLIKTLFEAKNFVNP